MIKRAFVGLNRPRLRYDLAAPDLKEPEIIPPPPRMVLIIDEPLDSTRGTIIKKGDLVKKGEKLLLYKESTTYTVSPVSGAILSIESHMGNFGKRAAKLTIEADKKETVDNGFAETADSPSLSGAADFLASLPGVLPFKAWENPDREISTLIITGVDEDLMCTTRQSFLKADPDELQKGIGLIKKITGITKIFLTVPEEMDNFSGIEGAETIRISSEYPGANPHMIMKDHLDLVVPSGQTCEDLGVSMVSIEAVIAIYRTYEAKLPFFEKRITVIGKDEVAHHVSAVIGTPIQVIFQQLGLETHEKDRIIIGGPMKGSAAYTLLQPVEPDTDAIIIQESGSIPSISDYPCINCGKCVKICPAHIPVNVMARYLEADLFETAADQYDLMSCIECGLCSYVCTARIPLFQYIKLGKYELIKLQSEIETEAANA